ncbi:hypothetical protein FORC066_0602 [Yersinia enterocolitica]|nr:hypothetical protein FORC066_0602 [Yersinia enterocolitica]
MLTLNPLDFIAKSIHHSSRQSMPACGQVKYICYFYMNTNNIDKHYYLQ